MHLGDHVIWADLHLDEGELEQFSRAASVVQVGEGGCALVLDAFDERICELLAAGELGWVRYDDHEWSLLLCVHPVLYADAERSASERREVHAEAMVSPETVLPLAAAEVRRALAAGGQSLYVTLNRIEIRVRVEPAMARRLLAGHREAPLGHDALPAGNARPVLWCPDALRSGQVPYRRLH